MGFEVVLGALIAWAVAKVRRAGKTLDGVADEVVDAAAARTRDKIRDVVLAKLAGDSAVRKLEEEVAETGEVSERTVRRVRDAVEAAADDDARFRAELEAAIAEAQQHGGSVAMHEGRIVHGTAQASGGGIAVGAVGGDANVGQPPGPRQPDRA